MTSLRRRARALLAQARSDRQCRYPDQRQPVPAPAPQPNPEVPAATPAAPAMAAGTVVLGRDQAGLPFGLDLQSRLRHLQAIGTTGSGKSNLFLQMARQDIEDGHGVLFLDPHGSHPDSGYRRLVAWLADSGVARRRTIHLIDPNAGTHCTGFNPLALPEGHHASVVAEAAFECFQRLWGDEDPDAKPTIQRLLPAVLGALTERKLTLAEAISLLDPDDRDGVRGYLADTVQDDYAREELSFLQDISLERGGRQELRIELTGPRNRIAKLLRAPAIRTMVGQTERVIDLREAMDAGHVILCNLSGGGLVYEKAADLLGRLLLRFLVFHAKRRRQPQRLFAVYADECQRYLSGDVPVALAELRKQGVALALGSQWQSQLAEAGDEVLSAVRNATNIKIAFQLKDHKEASDLAEMLIPLNLEEPIATLNKETVVGHRLGRLRQGSTTLSTGTSSESGYSVTASTSVTRSTQTTIGSADTISHSTTRSHASTQGRSVSDTVTTGTAETVGESGSHTSGTGGAVSASSASATSAGITRNYDSPVAWGLPDSCSTTDGTDSSEATGSSSSWAESDQSGWSNASTTSESVSHSEGSFSSETFGEAHTEGTAHTESTARSEGSAHTSGEATGRSYSTGSNSGRATSDGYSEALIPIMALRPGGVHSKENQTYKAAQLLRSLQPGRCIINYVGPKGPETAMLRIGFRAPPPLTDEAFAHLRRALFERSPSACPLADAEAALAVRKQALLAAVSHHTLQSKADEPDSFRVPAPRK